MIKSKRGGGWSKQSSSKRKKAAMPVLLLSQPLIPASPAAPSLNSVLCTMCTYKMTWFWIPHLNSFFHVCIIEHSKKSFISQTIHIVSSIYKTSVCPICPVCRLTCSSVLVKSLDSRPISTVCQVPFPNFEKGAVTSGQQSSNTMQCSL